MKGIRAERHDGHLKQVNFLEEPHALTIKLALLTRRRGESNAHLPNTTLLE